MRLSAICIERPVLTVVMSLVIVLFGSIALPLLNNRELPDIDTPVVSVTTVYLGAAAEVVETSVTQPLEEMLNGIAGVKHVTSTSREQVSSISLEFDLAQDIEAAASDVRDRVARARSRLPDDVQEPLVAKRDADASPIMWLALYGQEYDQVELTGIVDQLIVDRIDKLPGVSNVMIAGERRYSMRVWIDNRKLGARNLAITEVVEALQRENVDIPSGRVEGSDTEFTVRSLGELTTPEEFGSLLIANVGGKPVRLREIAEVEAGAEDTRKQVRFNGGAAIGLGIVKQSTANTVAVAEAVRAEVELIQQELGAGLTLDFAVDSSRFIKESIRDVQQTIFEAAILVVLVIYIFLRSVRATIVPAVAIPVSIIGTFAVLYFMGYTINTLTLMGITLAIGLVVDDAIVVLENITRWVESGTPPLEAARQGMDEIAFAVVSATLSAVAVFLPLTFMQDMTGQLFREFAVTVASALLISGFVALTLSPMLCARVVKPRRREGRVKRALARALEIVTQRYADLLGRLLHRPSATLAIVVLGVLWVGFGIVLYGQAKEELLPASDRSLLIMFTRAPEGSTVEYMDRYQRQAERLAALRPETRGVLGVIALGIGTPGLVNQGVVFAELVPPNERELTQRELLDVLQPELDRIPGIQVFTIQPSPIRGFRSSPIELVIQGPDIFELARIADEVKAEAEESGVFMGLRSNVYLNKPQLDVSIDRERANDLGMSVREIATTLQILLGGLDVSRFKKDGETYDVIAQLSDRERKNPSILLELFVRGHAGLIPLAAVVDAAFSTTPQAMPHYDRHRAVTIRAGLTGGQSQGVALALFKEIAERHIPAQGGYRVRYSGEAEKFFEAGNSLVFAYLLAILIVFLVLAAQFESFLYPLVILVAVFLSFTGALLALEMLGVTLNIFSKIGVVMLVGLVTKNSILIVEFANQLRRRGMRLIEATLEASRTRFRPILMTALATMVGILPIAAGIGAGGSMRQGLGVAVIGGMLFSTALTFFVVPATYVGVEQLRARRAGRREEGPAEESDPARDIVVSTSGGGAA
ncbi:MAG: efflux RND transporter permease subunit [Deltaproteobacteria bacterium]|nr:efflux RND transporter permease subunit [Deltaproteobacteria bacterium]